jgi:hypothetical protein
LKELNMNAATLPINVPRVAVAAVWFYQGLWCKVFGGSARQAAIVAAVHAPGLPWSGLLIAIGTLETALAFWTLSGWRARPCAAVQTLLLIAMNAGGLYFATDLIPDPAGMVVQNAAFLTLAWKAAARDEQQFLRPIIGGHHDDYRAG